MAEALTESFCERCGTRYEFTAPARLGTLRKTRGLVSGLRNYILSQDSLGDAVGDAMRSEEESIAANQLEAFHSAFNFCIDCRQYACTNCWNDAAGRCRSCAPIAGKDDLADRLEAAYLADHQAMHAAPDLADDLAADEISRRLGVEAWPESDLAEVAATNGHAPVAWPEGIVAEQPTGAEIGVPEPAIIAEAPVTEPLASEPLAAELPTAEIVGPESEAQLEELHPILAWEGDTDLVVHPRVDEELPEAETPWVAAEAPAETSAEWVTAEAQAAFEAPGGWFADAVPQEPEPLTVSGIEPALPASEAQPLTAGPEPEPEVAVAETESTPMAASAEPVPRLGPPEVEPRLAPHAEEAPPRGSEEPPAPPAPPIPIIPRIRPISETAVAAPKVPPRPPLPAPTPIDEGALAARRAQLDLLGLEDPGVGTVEKERRVLPYRSAGASAHPSEIVRRTMHSADALWNASALEVAAARSAVAVQNCGGCGLSLSASARFCRRCGTRQAQPA